MPKAKRRTQIARKSRAPARKKAPARAASKRASAKPASNKKSAPKKTPTRNSKRAPAKFTEAHPVWYQPGAALGSAVRYVAGISPKFNWVGIYVLKGKHLELGPYLGAATDHVRIPVGRGVCGTAVAENRDMNVPDVSASDNYLACSLETKSELVVLVKDPKGEILGQIDIDSHTPNAFGPDEEKAVKQVAQELGVLWHA